MVVIVVSPTFAQVTADKPPGKTWAQFQSELASCSDRYGANTPGYAQCLVAFGNPVRGNPANDRSAAATRYQANSSCMDRARQARSDVERAQIVQNCMPHNQNEPAWVTGINLEKAGHYAEAAALYQKALNDAGMPNGDGMIVGERLAYLYASGRGVPKDLARARQLFSVRDSERNQTDLALLDRGRLPARPDDAPAALHQMQEQDAAAAARAAAREAAQPQSRQSVAQQCLVQCKHVGDQCQTSNGFTDLSMAFGAWGSHTNCRDEVQACLRKCD